MNTLIRFEDMYGATDLFKALRDIPYNIDDADVASYGYNIISGLSMQGIFRVSNADKGYISTCSRIIFVFDLDSGTSATNDLMSVVQFEKSVKTTEARFRRKGYTGSFEYLPTIYAAETVMLMQYYGDINPEYFVHTSDTLRYQCKLLKSMSGIHAYKEIKCFRKYLDVKRLKCNLENYVGYFALNTPLIEWLLGRRDNGLTAQETCDVIYTANELFNHLKDNPIDFVKKGGM